MWDERADTENSDRVDVARPPVRRAVAAGDRWLPRRGGTGHRRRHHPGGQRHRRGCAAGRRRSARGAAGLGGHALRPARRHPAQGRRPVGGEPGRAGLLDHARDRRHRAEGRFRGADGGQHPAPLGGDVHGAAGPDAAERRRSPVDCPSFAARRHRRDLAVQLPADLVQPRRGARARHRQRGRAQA